MELLTFVLLFIGTVPICLALHKMSLHEHRPHDDEVFILGEQHVELKLGTPTGEFTTECDKYKYFKVKNTHACKDLKITVSQKAGEPNVYVGRDLNKYPTPQSLAWSSYKSGSDILHISSWDPDFYVGTFYIAVHAYCGTDVKTNYTAAKYTVRADEVTSIHPRTTDLYGKTADVMIKVENYTYHRFCSPNQCVNVSVAIEHCMKPYDPGCNGTYGFPELLVSPTQEQPIVNHRVWMLAEGHIRSVDLSPADPDFNPGHFYVGVYGWCTPMEKCPDWTTCGPCNATDNMPVKLSVKPTTLTPKQCKELLDRRPKPIVNGQTAVLPTVSSLFLAIGLLVYYQ